MDLIEVRRKLLVGDPELPPIYQRVEYIKSTGTQRLHITNDFITDKQIRFVCQSDYLTSTQVITGFGAAGGNWFGGQNGVYSTGQVSFTNVSLTDKVNVIMTFPSGGNTLYVNVDGVEKMSTVFTPHRALTLFGAQGSSSWFYSSVKVFSLTIDGVANLIPCYRLSDDEIGMYNTVTRSFLTNQGTGTFIKGPAVH